MRKPDLSGVRSLLKVTWWSQVLSPDPLGPQGPFFLLHLVLSCARVVILRGGRILKCLNPRESLPKLRVDDAVRSPGPNEKLWSAKFSPSSVFWGVEGPLIHQAGKPGTGLSGLGSAALSKRIFIKINK